MLTASMIAAGGDIIKRKLSNHRQMRIKCLSNLRSLTKVSALSIVDALCRPALLKSYGSDWLWAGYLSSRPGIRPPVNADALAAQVDGRVGAIVNDGLRDEEGCAVAAQDR